MLHTFFSYCANMFRYSCLIKVKNTLEKNYDHEFIRMRETTGTSSLENQMQVG